jgi:hypothetical protein
MEADMGRLLRGIIDADPIVLGVTVALTVLLGAAWALSRLRERRP